MVNRPSARLRRVDDIRLKFAGTAVAEFPLGPGMHAIGRGDDGDGTIGVVDEHQPALVRFCVDRRGIWLTVDDSARGVHVNGRPVRRMALLRVGDCIYVDGVELVLVAGTPAPAVPAKLGNAPVEVISDPRIVLRGVGGHYHGRSFTLERPRLVGRSADADIRIDDSTFADRHARIDLQGDVIVLRDLGSATGSVVNGATVRDAVLKPGDQIVFDAHHRFVIEAPARAPQHDLPPSLDDSEEAGRKPGTIGQSARRLPWLLLAALLIAGALSALLLFGVSA
jgi:pSer/pThr/pTyr-binding forkhead associated (FHA) protein